MDRRNKKSVDLQMWVNQKKPEGMKKILAPNKYNEIWLTPRPWADGENILHQHSRHLTGWNSVVLKALDC
jgi:hypothetical protein